MPEKATHVLMDKSPEFIHQLQALLRHRAAFDSEEEMREANAGWEIDPDARYGAIGTEVNKLVFLVRYSDEERGKVEPETEIVGTVSVGHNPEDQVEWYDKGYRVLSDKHIYAKNVIMTLMKKEVENESSA